MPLCKQPEDMTLASTRYRCPKCYEDKQGEDNSGAQEGGFYSSCSVMSCKHFLLQSSQGPLVVCLILNPFLVAPPMQSPALAQQWQEGFLPAHVGSGPWLTHDKCTCSQSLMVGSKSASCRSGRLGSMMESSLWFLLSVHRCCTSCVVSVALWCGW